MRTFADQHQHGHMVFADGVAMMTRRNFGESTLLLDEARRLLQDHFGKSDHPDIIHIDFFRSVVMSAAGQLSTDGPGSVAAA